MNMGSNIIDKEFIINYNNLASKEDNIWDLNFSFGINYEDNSRETKTDIDISNMNEDDILFNMENENKEEYNN